MLEYIFHMYGQKQPCLQPDSQHRTRGPHKMNLQMTKAAQFQCYIVSSAMTPFAYMLT